MTIKNLILLVALTVVFGSCSNRIYSYREKIKVDQKEVVKIEKKKAIDTETAMDKPSEIINEISDEKSEIITAGTNETPTILASTAKINLKSDKTITTSKTKATHQIKNEKLIKKANSLANSSVPGVDSTVRKLLLIGLVLILAGIILAILTGGLLGHLVYAIGVILLIVALILWLLNIL